ncbi:mitochondrial mRNA pseudouridine synthase TRUB2 isoform X2 [Scyliorhinus canicula]|uniref:mitochondrial mRNA pseudouridine synthase TRUB2 isoform X2 n=1 Tax=Scyliorhinus canicula TaxID=7830 RepID=UPI0018F45D45|nr:mitochondrial mRNA pseudouridine synthase TRUB2 isoform X2 [Scyliorhinus canicula]
MVVCFQADRMVRLTWPLFQTLRGLFAVYKPPGVHWKRLRDTVETKLLKELNSLEQRVPRQQIRFLPSFTEGENGVETSLTVAQLPVLADHPRVLGVGNGNQQLVCLHNRHLTKEYTVQGSFGTATEDFSDTGRLIERTTYDHITLERLERIIAVIQGIHQRALLTYSGIDLKSQEAYELASRGLLRPMHKSPPIITAIRCVHLSPPKFTLAIQCLHETQQYLRKMVHEIGLELKSSAVCTHVRRTRDGIFTVEDALVRTRWDLQSIQAAIQDSRSKVNATLGEDSSGYSAILGEDMPTGVKGQERRSRRSGPRPVGD